MDPYPPAEPTYEALDTRSRIDPHAAEPAPWRDGPASESWNDDYETAFPEPYPVLPPPRQARPSQRTRTSRGRAPGRAATRPALPPLRLPATLTRADFLHDQIALALLGIAAVSALVMAGVLAGQVGTLPDVLALRYDAVGAPTRWGTPSSLWELPLLAGMVTIINLVLAGWLSSYDRFAGRFLLATATVVSILAWIPLVRFLW